MGNAFWAEGIFRRFQHSSFQIEVDSAAAKTLSRTTSNTIVKSKPLAKGENSGVIGVCRRIRSEPASAIKDLVGNRAEQRRASGAATASCDALSIEPSVLRPLKECVCQMRR